MELPSIFDEYKFINTSTTRLGGVTAEVETENSVEAFAKIGVDQERREILREIRLLKARVGVEPFLIREYDDGTVAALVTQRVSGRRLDSVLKEVTLEESLQLLWNLLENIDPNPSNWVDSLPNAVEEELRDIEEYLLDGKIDLEQVSKELGCDATKRFEWLRAEFQKHNADRLTHGDLCLPNALVQDDSAIILIDWGKSGKACIERDLASLKWSLERNQLSSLWEHFIIFLSKKNLAFDTKMIPLYREIDFFWYSYKPWQDLRFTSR